MIPQLNPADVNATGAYQLAMALAMVSMGIGAILRFLPSRKWKAEGRDLMKSAFEAVLLGSSIMTVEFILGILREKIGYPDWPSLLRVVDNLANAGWVTLQWVIPLAFIFGAVVGALDILSKIIPVIATFVMHFFMAVAFSILAFFSSLAAILILFSNIIKMITVMAAHAYHVIALGIALFAWKHTRSLGISLLVFGIALFYGLPVMLGFVKPAEPYVADPDEEARAKVLLALTENSVPTKISVISAGGKPLYFSYVSMNSSVLVKDVPLNSTLIANNTGSPPRNERGDATFRFVYGRFYNEGYPRASICTPAELFCIEMGPDYSKVKELKHQLYRNSTVQYVWYLGLLLPVRDNRVQVEGPSLAKPLFDLPSDPIQIAASLRNVLGGLRSEDEYWEMVYGRSKPVRIEVPVIRELNENVTAFVLFNETKYKTWHELGITRQYVHRYTVPKVSEQCWVSRVVEYFDESCNCTRTIVYKKARAEYRYMTPYDERLVLVHLPGTSVSPKILDYVEDGRHGTGNVEIVMEYYHDSPAYALEKGLILGYQSLTLKFNQGIIKTQRISQETNEAANRIKGNPGTGSGTTRGLEEPFQKVVTLNPKISVWTIAIRHTKVIETGEREGECPSTPDRIEAMSLLGFDAKNSEPWDPYKTGIFRWEEYSKTGEYEYRAPASLGSAPALGAYKPSDPRLVHRLYEEDPREPEANLDKYDVSLLMRFGEPISQLSYMLFALVVAFALADGVTGWLGGTSLGLAGFAMSMVGQMTGKMKLFSPVAIFRYPLFGRDMSKWAMKRLEDRIWKDAEQKLKKKAFETKREWWKVKDAMEEAMNKADEEMIKELKKKEQMLKSTYWSLIEYRSISKELKRAQGKKSLMRAFGVWGIYNLLKHGDPERNLKNLERRRLEVLSRLLPDEAVMIRQLRDWRTEVKLSWREARDLIRKIMRESKNERFWPGRFSKLRRASFILTPLALLMHKEGRDTLFTALAGWPEAKVTKAWAQMAYDSPLAYRKLGIEWAKLGGKEVPVPEMKGQILGPGFTYEMEKRKYALVREELKPEELKMYVEEQLDIMRKGAGQKRNEEELFYEDIFTDPVPPNAGWARQKGEELLSPLDVLRKSDSLREVSTSDFIKVLEGKSEKNLPFWNAIPVHRIDENGGKPEVKYEDTHANFLIHYKDFHRNASKGQHGNEDENNKKDRFWFLWNEPKFEFTRAEAGEHVKIDGTRRENLSERDLSDIGIDPREAMDEFRRYAKDDKTEGLGDDWAWFGKVTGGGVLDPDAMEKLGTSEKKPDDRKPEVGEGNTKSVLDKVDSAGIEKVRESAGDSLREATKSRSRTGELWGDGE